MHAYSLPKNILYFNEPYFNEPDFNEPCDRVDVTIWLRTQQPVLFDNNGNIMENL